MMKGKHNGGFSLVEVLVAITLMASIVVPVCTGMLVAPRVNAKAEAMLDAKIAVSSAVETLMAEGIPAGQTEYTETKGNITVKVTPVDGLHYYNVEVTDEFGLVKVETSIRAVAQDVGGSDE